MVVELKVGGTDAEKEIKIEVTLLKLAPKE